MNFNISETVTCLDCRETLNSSDEEHECVPTETYVFTAGDDTIHIDARNPTIAWKKLSKRVDSAIPYTYRGQESCGGQDSFVNISSVEFTQHTNIKL